MARASLRRGCGSWRPGRRVWLRSPCRGRVWVARRVRPDGVVRQTGWVSVTPEGFRLFSDSLAATDEVALRRHATYTPIAESKSGPTRSMRKCWRSDWRRTFYPGRGLPMIRRMRRAGRSLVARTSLVCARDEHPGSGDPAPKSRVAMLGCRCVRPQASVVARRARSKRRPRIRPPDVPYAR